MRTTLTQRITAAEALIATQRRELSRTARVEREKTATINKLVAERDEAIRAVEVQLTRGNRASVELQKYQDDLADAQVDNDRLQSRLGTMQRTIEAIRNMTHPWWMGLFPHSNCPICFAGRVIENQRAASE